MEHKTEFNLNESIKTWRTELLKHRSMSTDDVMELESHILDEINYLILNGVHEKEAFNIAQNNLGKVEIITTEFKKIEKSVFSKKRILPFAATFLILIFSLTVTDLFSTRIDANKFLNLNFEESSNYGKPDFWFIGGNEYEVKLDKTQEGHCLKMQSINPIDQDFGVYTGTFPIDIAKNKTIEYRAKIKTKNVDNGYAGLWWRVDGLTNSQYGFDNMYDRGLVGDNDWTTVSIKMKIHNDAKKIKFGGLFTGEGTAWFDDLEIYIDGKKYIEKPNQIKKIAAFNKSQYDKYEQTKDKKYNLDFEASGPTNKLSKGWFKWGSHDLSLEQTNPYQGNYSAIISSNDKEGFGSVAYKIPSKYKGNIITLEGYMKTENVNDGYAGLLLRIDKDGESIGFDNMEDQAIKGTNSWKKYKVSFEFDESSEFIFVAGILVGSGKAWFDDFKLSIDSVDIQHIEPVLSIAEKDTEYDNGSNIALTDLSGQSVQSMELLGRVWGFLKYHHPNLVTGDYNWDYELFRFIPKYIKVKTQNEKDKLLVEWINQYGTLEDCTDCAKRSEDAYIKPNLSWINTSDVSKELSISLMHVYKNRCKGKQYYIAMAPNVGNPIFKNEDSYKNMPYPDVGFRLLSLYRYWNMIEYFFPYKNIIDKNWNDVLGEYIPQFINAKDELSYENTALRIIGDIQDTHANLWGGGDKIKETKGSNYAPFHVKFIQNKLVVDDYFSAEYGKNGILKIGDVITTINDKSIEEIIKEWKPYYPASNPSSMLRNMSFDMLRSNNDKVNISYISKGKNENTTVSLYKKDSIEYYRWYKEDDNESYKLLEGNIGYITMKSITDEDIDKIKSTFKDTKGIIIDIRNYPSAFVPFSLGSYFLKEETPFVKFSGGNINNPGEFTMTHTINIPPTEDHYKGKLIILVNEITQSSAEYHTMAFQAGDNTTVIGSQTSGADGNVSKILLPGGLRTMISGIGVFYPDGKETQRIGIVPDIELYPTVEGIKNGKDELLEKAKSIILE